MLKRSLLAALAFAAVSAAPRLAVATERTITLSVPSMYCAACPISVRKALEKVPGVQKAKATYEPKEAVVTFDDGKTTIELLLEATKRAGFPALVKER